MCPESLASLCRRSFRPPNFASLRSLFFEGSPERCRPSPPRFFDSADAKARSRLSALNRLDDLSGDGDGDGEGDGDGDGDGNGVVVVHCAGRGGGDGNVAMVAMKQRDRDGDGSSTFLPFINSGDGVSLLLCPLLQLVGTDLFGKLLIMSQLLILFHHFNGFSLMQQFALHLTDHKRR